MEADNETPLESEQKDGVERLTDIQLILLGINTEMTINTKEMNRLARMSGGTDGSIMYTDGRSPQGTRKVNFEVDDYLNKLIQSGQGLNLTLFNPNPRKDDDQDDD